MDFVDFMLTFSMNCLVISGGFWAVLRVFEKVFDILLKNQQYEKNKEVSE